MEILRESKSAKVCIERLFEVETKFRQNLNDLIYTQ